MASQRDIERLYAATIWEADHIVPWSDPIFESVSSNVYIEDRVGWTENWIMRHLSRLERRGKPVDSTESGCPTYKGAREQASSAFLDEDLAKYPYDEDDQASYIARYCEMLNKANISGAFSTG